MPAHGRHEKSGLVYNRRKQGSEAGTGMTIIETKHKGGNSFTLRAIAFGASEPRNTGAKGLDRW